MPTLTAGRKPGRYDFISTLPLGVRNSDFGYETPALGQGCMGDVTTSCSGWASLWATKYRYTTSQISLRPASVFTSLYCKESDREEDTCFLRLQWALVLSQNSSRNTSSRCSRGSLLWCFSARSPLYISCALSIYHSSSVRGIYRRMGDISKCFFISDSYQDTSCWPAPHSLVSPGIVYLSRSFDPFRQVPIHRPLSCMTVVKVCFPRSSC